MQFQIAMSVLGHYIFTALPEQTYGCILLLENTGIVKWCNQFKFLFNTIIYI